MRDAVRVALLARPGAGADRLREALNAAGAQLVLEADPTTLEPATLAGANAESVVVLLDAAVEEPRSDFDPDAAMARYLARRGAARTAGPTGSAPSLGGDAPRPPAGSFGRKGILH